MECWLALVGSLRRAIAGSPENNPKANSLIQRPSDRHHRDQRQHNQLWVWSIRRPSVTAVRGRWHLHFNGGPTVRYDITKYTISSMIS